MDGFEIGGRRMTITLTQLEPRLAPSAGFADAPGVPVTVLYLADGDTLVCAGVGGGPRVELRDGQGVPVWSVFVADPTTRRGVNPEAFRLLLAAGADVVQVVEVPPQPKGIDPAANTVTKSFGLLDAFTRIGVGLVFATPPDGGTQDLQARIYLPQDVWTALAESGQVVDPYSVYVAIGDDLSKARDLPTYVDIELGSEWDVADIVNTVLGRLK